MVEHGSDPMLCDALLQRGRYAVPLTLLGAIDHAQVLASWAMSISVSVTGGSGRPVAARMRPSSCD